MTYQREEIQKIYFLPGYCDVVYGQFMAAFPDVPESLV